MSRSSRIRSLRPGLARRFASLGEVAIVASALGSFARDEGPGALLDLLGAVLCDHREARDPLAARILASAARLLSGPGGSDLAATLLGLARERGEADLARFLESPSPLILAEIRSQAVIRGRGGKPLTLGERKSLARNPRRLDLDRLLADPSPEVVRNLLRGPRITENDVVRIAARRPADPEILREIAVSRRWASSYRVRIALLENPWLDPAIGVKIAPLALEQDLRRLARDHALHPRLRELCGRILRAEKGDDAPATLDPPEEEGASTS